MPALLAAPWLGTAIAGIAGGTGAIVGAKMSAGAAKDAAQLSTDAANHAADAQAKAQADTLAFQKQQAENDWRNAQLTSEANYSQAKARYGSIAGVASQYGLNLGDMPAFTPGIDPHFDTGATALPSSPTVPNTTSTTAGAAPQTNVGNLSDPSAWMGLVGNDQQLAAWVKAQNPGLSDQTAAYYVGKIKGQPGANPTEQAGSANYWAQKIKSDPTTGGAGSINAAAKAPTALTAGLLAPTGVAPVTTPIPTPYQPGSIAAMRRPF